MADKRDFYEVLGVDRNADDAALKRAYRKLAKKYHPDSHPGDKAAEEKFKEASEAYAILSDPDKRRQYDQFGMGAFEGNGAGGAGGFDFSGMDFGDIFGDLFGGFGSFGGFGGSSAQRGPHKGANVHAHQLRRGSLWRGQGTGSEPEGGVSDLSWLRLQAGNRQEDLLQMRR